MSENQFKPGQQLADFDPDGTGGYEKKDADSLMKDLEEQLDDLQEILFAEKKHAVAVHHSGNGLQWKGWCSEEGTKRSAPAGL